MIATVLDGISVSKSVYSDISRDVIDLKKIGYKPGLCIILIGNNILSKIYIKNKIRACRKYGIFSLCINLSYKITENELIDKINDFNNDDRINGILIQLPVPNHININKIVNTILPEKDVECLNIVNIGKLVSGIFTFYPCTPYGIIKILKEYNININGSNAVILSRSNIVGKPMSILLLQNDATVTICHKKTINIKRYTSIADILITAIGLPHIIKSNMIKIGSVVIDVGIYRRKDGKLFGDVDFDNIKNKAGYITPVPGGVGPVTISMLLYNTILSLKKKLCLI